MLKAVSNTGGGGGGTGNASTSNVTISSNTTLSAAANTIYNVQVTAPCTVTLPTAVGNTSIYNIKAQCNGTVSVATTLAQTIDGLAAPISLVGVSAQNNYPSQQFVSDTANWSRF